MTTPDPPGARPEAGEGQSSPPPAAVVPPAGPPPNAPPPPQWPAPPGAGAYPPPYGPGPPNAAYPPGTPYPPYGSGPPYGAYPPARRTNVLAIISLVAGCAQMFFFLVASIVAVVTGHVARRQIKQSGEQGAGMALAGLVLGYIGIGFAVAGITGLLVFVFGFSGSVAQSDARNDARSIGRAIAREVALEDGTPRDPQLLLRVYVQETDSNGTGCCSAADVRLADGTRFEDATAADWDRVGWRIEVEHNVFYTRAACLTVPASAGEAPSVQDGHCPP